MNLTNADLFCTYTDRTNIKSTIIKLKRIFLPCDFFTVPIPDSSFNYAFAPVRLYLQIIDIETTAEASDKGTQALGTVHKDVEEKVTLSDRQDILDVLNYDMADIFAMLGIDTTGGEFCYPEKKLIEPEKKMSILTQLRTNVNLPVGDDYLYEEFGIEKPANYDELKKRQEEKAAEIEAAKARETEKTEEDKPDPEEEPELEKHGKGTPKEKKNALKNAYNWLKRFFGKAPGRDGAALEW